MVLKVVLAKAAVAAAVGLAAGLGAWLVPDGAPRLTLAQLADGQRPAPEVTGMTGQVAAAADTVGTAGAPGAVPKAQAAVETAVFDWPLPRPIEIARAFDRPGAPWLAGHRGVDLAATPGQTVLAPAAGQVTYAGWIVDRDVLVIKHDDLASTLEPVTTDLTVGTWVQAGAAVGQLAAGQASHCQPACLHWGVRRGDYYLDPTSLIDPPPRAVLWR
ncbi:MAG: peptidoglycan DD-metalloendopeptidase family protein [Bifidobacteriaceae bacterium]|jgi:murein DD-endopeptidase MepM/ murein hydrolase activator NlpD|nr:peptidoglycan DD-metalloendopeptidase family protein [Bifidobacteriaceae bacterium]